MTAYAWTDSGLSQLMTSSFSPCLLDRACFSKPCHVYTRIRIANSFCTSPNPFSVLARLHAQ